MPEHPGKLAQPKTNRNDKDERLMEEDRKHFGKKDLILKESQFKYRGLFTCKAENLLGIAEESANVTVKGKNT